MKRHSLLFGICAYERKNGFHPLTCPTRDAEALARVLDDPAFVGDEKRVTVRLDRTCPEAEQDLRHLLSSPDLNPKEDLIHIHFSGHGMRDDDGKFYLCFVDTDARELAFSGLSYEKLKHWLEVKRVQRALITLDCCYSGAAIHKDAMTSGAEVLSKVIQPEPGADLAQGKGYCVITATGDRELAVEGKAGVHGSTGGPLSIFTHYMVEGITSGAADRGDKGYVTAADLHGFVAAAVRNDASAMHPQIGGKTDGDILVARNPKAMERKRQLQQEQNREAFETRRAALAVQVRAWLARQYAEDVFDAVFVAEVEDWLEGATAGTQTSRRYALLEQAVEKRIRAVAFHELWRQDKSGPRMPLEAEARPSVSDRPPRDETPTAADIRTQEGARRTVRPKGTERARPDPSASGGRTAGRGGRFGGKTEYLSAAIEVAAIGAVGIALFFAVGTIIFEIMGFGINELSGPAAFSASFVLSVIVTRFGLLRTLHADARSRLALSALNLPLRAAYLSVPPGLFFLAAVLFSGPADGVLLATTGIVVVAQLVTLFLIDRRS